MGPSFSQPLSLLLLHSCAVVHPGEERNGVDRHGDRRRRVWRLHSVSPPFRAGGSFSFFPLISITAKARSEWGEGGDITLALTQVGEAGSLFR